MSQEKMFLYTVRPRKQITGIPGIPVIRTPKSLMLSLDDVKKCLPNATVWRRFTNHDLIERVTVGNAERLHNEMFISEEEWAKMGNTEDANVDLRGIVLPDTANVVEESAPEPVKEEVKVEEPVVENNIEVSNTEPNNNDGEIEDEKKDETTTVDDEQPKQDDAKVEDMENEDQTSETVLADDVVVEDVVEDTTAPEEATKDEVENDEDAAQAETATEDEESVDVAQSNQQDQNNSNQHVKYNNKKHKK